MCFHCKERPISFFNIDTPFVWECKCILPTLLSFFPYSPFILTIFHSSFLSFFLPFLSYVPILSLPLYISHMVWHCSPQFFLLYFPLIRRDMQNFSYFWCPVIGYCSFNNSSSNYLCNYLRHNTQPYFTYWRQRVTSKPTYTNVDTYYVGTSCIL